MSNARSIAAIVAPLALCGVLAQGASAQGLADVYKIRDGVFGSHIEYHGVAIPRGKEVVLADLTGPGKVTYWYFTDDTNGKLYPGLVLKVFWDDEPAPSIDVPLADFFGAMGGHTIDYQSAPLKIEHFCYMCYLPMPFARRGPARAGQRRRPRLLAERGLRYRPRDRRAIRPRVLKLRFLNLAPKGQRHSSPGGGNPACGVGPGNWIGC